jgi:hypothetical protein
MADKFSTLYIETTRGARTALVRSTGSNPVGVQLNPIVSGDTVNLNLILLTDGAIDTDISGKTNFTIKAGFGQSGGTTYATSSNWYVSSSIGYTGSINTNTAAMSSSLIGNEAITALFEVEMINTDTNSRKTYLQTPVQIYGEVIPQ